MKHGEVGQPGTHFVPQRRGKRACRLRDVTEVVGDPGGKELPERDGAQLGMFAGERKLARGEAPGTYGFEILLTEPGELIEQVGQGSAAIAFDVAEPIEWLEPAIGALHQDDPGPRDPVRFLAVDQVADHVEGTPLTGGPASRRDGGGHVRQQLMEHRGRPAERGEGTFEIQLRGVHSYKVQVDPHRGNRRSLTPCPLSV